MTTLRRFTAEDLFHFNNVNLDHLTETYNTPFYLQYLSRWPHLCLTAEAPGGEIMGYRVCLPPPFARNAAQPRNPSALPRPSANT